MAATIGSLDQEIDTQLNIILRSLVAEIKLSKRIEQLGGREVLLQIFSDQLKQIPLEHKLDLIIRGHHSLGVLIERFAKLWIHQTKGLEFLALETALAKAGLLVTPSALPKSS